MNIVTLFLVFLFVLGHTKAQSTSDRFEINKNLPVYYDRMKSLLTYPMSWQSQKNKDFDVWKKQAREILFECMDIVQPAPDDYDMKVIDSEQREGYRALKIEFNISKWTRVPAYLLVPDGEGIFPSVFLTVKVYSLL